MKTAISLPDRLFSDAEQIAQDLGIPRSQLFAIALEEFIRKHRKDDITNKLNIIYSNNDLVLDANGIDASLISMRELTKNDAW